MIRSCQALLLLGLAAQLLVGDRGSAFLTCFGLHLIASAAWLYLCLAVLRGDYRPGFPEAFGLTLALHLLALFLAPALSDDIYRYLFEGRLVLDGLNPYLTAPGSEAALPYSQSLAWFENINNPEISAAYPPAVQYALALGVLLSSDPLGMKLVFGGFSLGIFLLLWCWLPDLGVNRRRAILFGYCPLMALEFAGEGHSDSLAVFFLVAACMASGRGRGLTAGALLALATAGKLLPILFLPFLMRRSRSALASFGIGLFLLYLPFIPWSDPRSANSKCSTRPSIPSPPLAWGSCTWPTAVVCHRSGRPWPSSSSSSPVRRPCTPGTRCSSCPFSVSGRTRPGWASSLRSISPTMFCPSG
ncbi:MAG: glycosyltransferase 87 family protein [Planctomycetota bacterium]